MIIVDSGFWFGLLDRKDVYHPARTAFLRQCKEPLIVLLAEHLGHGRILSSDQRDFHTYRWKNYHPFTNLLSLYG